MIGKKLINAAAGAAAGGEGLYVEDVFSTYLYTGNGSTQTITNGIDLDGEGGLVWIKNRGVSAGWGLHFLFDTERSPTNSDNMYYLQSSSTSAQSGTNTDTTKDFGGWASDGFLLGSPFSLGADAVNGSGSNYASWTFRKAPKFFDVVTYTGDGNANNEITHNLGSVPGCIIIKNTSGAWNWLVYHKDSTFDLNLNTTSAGSFSLVDAVTSTSFNFSSFSSLVNASGSTYVAYLFAHNDGDGEFGESGDQDIIKCGSYTGNGSTTGPVINLGYEPQWLLLKQSSASGASWFLLDNMRGVTADGLDQRLFANDSAAEGSDTRIAFNATGFQPRSGSPEVNQDGQTYIYIAIRRGPMKTPESGTEVFAMDTFGGTAPTPPSYVSGFPVDMVIQRLNKNSTSDPRVNSRLTNTNFMYTSQTSAETSDSGYTFDYMNGFRRDTGTDANDFTWMFRRSPGFFDVVAWTGDGTSSRTINHNLGVAPELMIVKNRVTGTQRWRVYVSSLGATKYLELNTTNQEQSWSGMWSNTSPTDTVFTVGDDQSVNESGSGIIAYLFATLAGVSKVGSYTGNGTSQTIDCGFSSGARFVLIKKSSGTGDWHVWDTERGIVSGNDPFLELNTTNAENTSYDSVDPDSSGFVVNEDAGTAINTSGGTYIYLAIA